MQTYLACVSYQFCVNCIVSRTYAELMQYLRHLCNQQQFFCLPGSIQPSCELELSFALVGMEHDADHLA